MSKLNVPESIFYVAGPSHWSRAFRVSEIKECTDIAPQKRERFMWCETPHGPMAYFVAGSIEIDQYTEDFAGGFYPFLHGGESGFRLDYGRDELILGAGAALQVADYCFKI